MNNINRSTWTIVGLATLSFGCMDPDATNQAASPEQVIESSREALTVDPTLLSAFDTSLRVDLLTPYYPTAQDTGYGGFVEDRSGTWVLQQDSDKFVVMQARYVWTASKASQFYATSNPTQAAQYKASAAVGFDFLKRMWRDSANGFGLMADRNGSNLRNSGKETFIVYGNAFGMFGAAAYYAASADPNALTLATNAFTYLDTYFYDSQYGGYYITASDKRKETDTNVHVLEALVELYNALPASHALRSTVLSRVSQLVTRFHDYAMHCPATNDCFTYPVMNQDWTASTSDISFGHDLELSVLMVQAISTLGQDPLSSPYITKIKKVVDFTFSHGGYRSDGGFYYTGSYNNGSISINDSQLQWWPQAEGLGALCLMGKLFPSDTSYGPLLNKSWGFINTQVIDHTNHGWVRQANDWNIAKAWEWHCNYHDGRALMNCLNWLSVCTPKTCASLSAACGAPSDGCGGTLSCGTCQTGQTCNASYQCVTATNTAPVVNAGSDRTVTLPFTLTIAGSVTDDGLPTPPALTVAWSKTSGPGTATFSPANAATTTITFSTAGTYLLRLTASDGALSAYDEVQVTVSATNTAPVVNAGADRTVTLPSTLAIAGTVTDDGLPTPPALTVAWSKTSGPGTATFTPANAATTTITFSTAGTYLLRLTASDGALSAFDEVQVTVSATNTAPVVNAGADLIVTLPSTLTIAGTVTDDGLPTPPALTVAWSKTSGPGTATFNPANAATTTITFSAAGTYVLRLTASDGALSAYDEVQVTVSSGGGTNPCDGICTGPTNFTVNGSYSSGNLGTSTVCRQTTSAVHGGNCGNFASPRTLSVNGTTMSCSGGNWSSIPAARNGGYCISVTSGDYAWAYATLW